MLIEGQLGAESWDRLLTREPLRRGVDFLQLLRIGVCDSKILRWPPRFGLLAPLHALFNPFLLRVPGTSASDYMIISLIS